MTSIRKAIFFFILIYVATLTLQAQEKDKKQSKQERKAMEEQQLILQKAEVLDIVNTRQWVIEASRVSDRTGKPYIVTPNYNFVGVNLEDASVQLSFQEFGGWNGMGGITLDGNITQYSVNEGKPTKALTINLRVSGALISSHQFITIDPNRNAVIEISGDDGGRISFEGKLKTLEESNIYKGMPLNK